LKYIQRVQYISPVTLNASGMKQEVFVAITFHELIPHAAQRAFRFVRSSSSSSVHWHMKETNTTSGFLFRNKPLGSSLHGWNHKQIKRRS
jgi:hypothetical protein